MKCKYLHNDENRRSSLGSASSGIDAQGRRLDVEGMDDIAGLTLVSTSEQRFAEQDVNRCEFTFCLATCARLPQSSARQVMSQWFPLCSLQCELAE